MVLDPSRAPAFATPVYITTYAGAATVNITTATGTLVKTGAGVLNSIAVNTAGAGSDVKVYDGTTSGGTLLGTISTAAQTVLNLGWSFTTGLFLTTENGTPANITVSYT